MSALNCMSPAPKIKCGEKTEIYSRVCGYHRPITKWNRGKVEEFSDRKVFRMDNLSSPGDFKKSN